MGIVDEIARGCHRRTRTSVLITALAIVIVGTLAMFFIYSASVSSGSVTLESKLLHEGESHVVVVPEQKDAKAVRFSRKKGTGLYCATGPLVDFPSQITGRWRCERSYMFSASSDSPALTAWYLLPGSRIDMELYHSGTGEAAIVLTADDARNWANFRTLSRPANLLWTAPWVSGRHLRGNVTIGMEGLSKGEFLHSVFVLVRNVTGLASGTADIETTFASASLPTTKCTTNSIESIELPYAAGGLYTFFKRPPDGYHQCAGKAEHQFSIVLPYETGMSKVVFGVPFIIAGVLLLSWYFCSARARALNTPALGDGVDVTIDQGTAYHPMK